MGKRVILADTEETVLSALEMEFLDKLNEDTDLEVITDPQYFEELFSKPQNADVLVCGEELFGQELQKHDIRDVFLLTERTAVDGSTAELLVKKIFKYSSPQKIVNQIRLVVPEMFQKDGQPMKEPIVVLVYSASGGVGKTTVAMGMCASLAKSYNKVLYINAERINTFQRWLNNDAALQNGIVSELMAAKEDMFNRIRHVIRSEVFDYLPPLPYALSALNLDVSVYEKLAESAKLTQEYDVIVVDTDTVFDSAKASLITKADRVLIVVNQSKASVLATNALLRNMSCSDQTKYYYVCNDFDPDESNALVAADIRLKFIVNEYIRHIKNIDSLTPSDLAGRTDIQNVANLVM